MLTNNVFYKKSNFKKKSSFTWGEESKGKQIGNNVNQNKSYQILFFIPEK